MAITANPLGGETGNQVNE